MVYTNFGFSDQYFKGSKKIENIDVAEMHYLYSSITVAYGISDKLTVESEFGYFWNKYQKFVEGPSYSASGASHIAAGIKYNFLHSIARHIEITAGMRAIAPLQTKSSAIPQNILPSNGNYGLGSFLLLHKGFDDGENRLMLIARAGMTFENKALYRYGNYLYTSGYYIRQLPAGFAGIAELRSEIRGKDRFDGNTFEDSGGYSVYFSPQLNYSYRSWNFSVLGDIPVYRYLFGSQLGKGFSLSLNINRELTFERQEEKEEVIFDEEYER